MSESISACDEIEKRAPVKGGSCLIMNETVKYLLSLLEINEWCAALHDTVVCELRNAM